MSASRGHRRVLKVLLTLQVAFTVSLLSIAFLFADSFRRAAAVDMGWRSQGLLIADFDLRAASVAPDQAAATINRVINTLKTISGVIHVGVTNAGLIPGVLSYDIVVPDSRVDLSDNTPSVNGVTTDYLGTLGVTVLEGRLFDESVVGRAPEVVVSERFASTVWPQGTAVGRCVKIGDDESPCSSVIGIIANRRQGVGDDQGASEVFARLGSEALPAGLVSLFPGREVAVRVESVNTILTEKIRQTIFAEAPGLTNIRVRTGAEYLDRETRAWSIPALIVGTMAGFALILSGFGIFATSSQLIEQRRKELAIRLVLGATRTSTAMSVLLEALSLVAVGASLGVAIGMVFGQVVKSYLYGAESSHNGFTMAFSTMLLAALLAASWPSIRASRTDMNSELRRF